MEKLEDRSLMAGVVNVKIECVSALCDVVITGDANANSVEITQPSLDRFKVTGKSNTRITGLTSFDLYDFNDDIRIDMKSGADTLVIRGNGTSSGGFDSISDLDAHDDLVIAMGTGNDTLRLSYFQAQDGDINIDLGTGADTFTASHIRAADDFITTNSTASRTRQNVKITLDDVVAEDDIDIDLSYSVDHVKISNSEADDWFVDLRSGKDKLDMKKCRKNVSSSLNGGSDSDLFNFYQLQSSFTYSGFEKVTKNNFS